MHNDLAAIPALENQGIKSEHANDYSSVGCVEPSSGGRTYGHTGAVYIIIPSAVELTLFNGKHRLTEDEQIGPKTGDPKEFKTFDEFMTAFETQLKWMIEQSVELNNKFGIVHQEHRPTPLLSALFEGPMDKGEDVIEGGALYNSSGATIIGLADTIDSISAIEAFVYNDGTVSMEDLLKAIGSNLTPEQESLRKRLQTHAPKFGTENPIADKNAKRLVKFLHNTYQSYTNYRGGKYMVGYWTMTMHAGFGMLIGATPNGRDAGESFASGITPVSGATQELNACLNSVASLDSEYFANGVALNLKYTPDEDREVMLDDFSNTVKAYFKQGGLQIQFNIITHKKLEDAWKNPQDYRDLLVRVSGYTAYFKDLNEQMKLEIINRTEYNLETGKAVSYS
jgi:formate C-acetyltransferase